MFADSDLQLWLETQQQAHQTQLVVYARSTRDTELGYRLDLIRRGLHGQSHIHHGGAMALPARQPQALLQLAVTLQEGDDCRLEVTTREGDKAPVVHRFDCLPTDPADAGSGGTTR